MIRHAVLLDVIAKKWGCLIRNKLDWDEVDGQTPIGRVLFGFMLELLRLFSSFLHADHVWLSAELFLLCVGEVPRLGRDTSLLSSFDSGFFHLNHRQKVLQPGIC